MSHPMRRRVVTLLVLALVVVGALGARALMRTEPIEVTALFDSTVGLYPGSDVQVLGVPVGKVTKVTAEGEDVRVTMELDPDQPIAADTKAVIIAPTMVSDRFVQMTEPWTKSEGGAKLSSGTVIERDHTAVPVEIDDLYAGLKDVADALGPNGANKHGALSKLIKVGAANLDGQGQNLNTMIQEFGKASATLSGVDDTFFSMLANLDQLNQMLVANDGAVSKVSTQFADVAGYLADDREDMGRAAKNLSAAMAVLDDFIAKNRANLETSVEQLVPTAKALTKHQKSLEEMIKLAPLLLHNLQDAYDPELNVIAARGDVNEVSLWSKDGLTAQTSRKAPPTLIGGAEGSKR